MKKRTKILLVLASALCATVALGACAKADTTHEDLAASGYNAIVRYVLNGGVFNAGHANVNVVDRLPVDKVAEGVKLVAPGKDRGGSAADTSKVDRESYIPIGWYRSMTPRESNGKPLDENGDLCEETGLPQGHVFKDRWDFEKDICTLDDFTQGVDEWGNTVYELTLYQAWAPPYTYEFYRQKTEEEIAAEKAKGNASPDPWLLYETKEFGVETKSLPIPTWSEKTGAMEYGEVPRYAGHTLDKVYADSALTQLLETEIPNGGTVDLENGTAENMIVRCYTTWLDGNRYHIYNAQQLIDNFENSGIFELFADLDFSTVVNSEGVQAYWTNNLGIFTGAIEGNGFKIKNLRSRQTNASNLNVGGFLGRMDSGAVLRNVTFENLWFSLERGTHLQGAYYGLLAGRIASDAVIENVKVSGTIHLGDLVSISDFTNFTVGLLCGNGYEGAFDLSEIDVVVDQVRTGYASGQAVYGWKVQAEIESDGTVRLAVNEDTTQDPNPVPREE